MDFTFTEDQLLFQDSVRDFLVNEVTPERIRETWESESGRSGELWAYPSSASTDWGCELAIDSDCVDACCMIC